MKKLILFIAFQLIVISSFTQNYHRSLFQDSLVKIPYKNLVASNQAYLQLKYYKKQSGLVQEQLHNKDVVIQYYERVYKKCNQSDSISTILLKNKNLEINELDILYKQEKRERKIQKTQKIGLAISLPVAAILSFLLGFYLAK